MCDSKDLLFSIHSVLPWGLGFQAVLSQQVVYTHVQVLQSASRMLVLDIKQFKFDLCRLQIL